ncbi:uncharacterized protein [Ambystoma mexicanum]|uniref:uncharacterized protein n=1 Tax=Ambystoma mexicanum TaxID=8296 RepID=UPI0037E97162
MGAKGPSPFLAVFLCVCSVCAELKISVISPVTATLGSDAFLECTFIVDKFPVDLKYLAIFWSFNGKELLRFVHGLKVLEPRASINETEIENGDASLLMSSVTVHDEGVYKCSVIYSPTKRQEFVTLTPQARPEIFIPQREAIIGKEALLRCCALGFYPVEIDIAWLRDGQILPGTSTSKPQQYANGTFRINSTVALLPAYSDAHLIFSCRVQHASLPGPLQEDIQLLLEEEKNTWIVIMAFSASLLVAVILVALVVCFLFRRQLSRKRTLDDISGPQTWMENEVVEVTCKGHNYPRDIRMEWQKVHKGQVMEISAQDHSGHQLTEPLLDPARYRFQTSRTDQCCSLATITSTLSITPLLQEDNGAVFRCVISMIDGSQREEKEFKDFTLCVRPKLQMKITTPEGWVRGTNMALTAANFYPRDLPIKWMAWDEELSHRTVPKAEADGTFSLTSTCTLNLRQVHDCCPVKVTVGTFSLTLQRENESTRWRQTERKDSDPDIDISYADSLQDMQAPSK